MQCSTANLIWSRDQPFRNRRGEILARRSRDQPRAPNCFTVPSPACHRRHSRAPENAARIHIAHHQNGEEEFCAIPSHRRRFAF
uniref:Uncharacterized protein n=1 Tax=Arundo donax TaxID=35708 RepID=A0A0A8Y4I9_ARUDO